jgi:hypothetical protein
MFTLAGTDIPIRVQGQVRPDEAPFATLLGLRESGFLLTARRLFAWRENGAGAPVPLPAIEHLLIDGGRDANHHHVVVLPRQALHAALVLARRGADLDETLRFVAALGEVLGVVPQAESLGPVQRFTFPSALSLN